MRPRLVLAVSTLAFGTALAAVPAFAQNAGPTNGNSQQSSGCSAYFQTTCSDKPYPMAQSGEQGGGSPQRTGAAENRGANPSTAATAQNYRYPTGRAMNDGGFPSEQAQYNGAEREQRTGSAENMEHAQARSEALGGEGTSYAFEPNGGGPYYNYAAGPSFAGGPMDQGATASCQARFRSYDPATGTYLGFDGIRHACP
jgi:BA14K-like protein